MEKESKKHLYLMAVPPIVYVGLVFVLMYSIDNDKPIYGIIYAAFAFTVGALVTRNFLRMTVFRGKRPYAPIRSVRPCGSDDEDWPRRITITVSGYIGRGKVKLFVDGNKIDEAEGGDRIRMSLSNGEHKVSVTDASGAGKTTPAEGDCEFYVWMNRNAKSSQYVTQIEEATKGIGDAEAKDAAAYRKSQMFINIAFAMTPIMGTIVIAAVLLLQ